MIAAILDLLATCAFCLLIVVILLGGALIFVAHFK